MKLRNGSGTKQINSLCLGNLMETTENGFGPVLDHKTLICQSLKTYHSYSNHQRAMAWQGVVLWMLLF
ncbi:predicted protein [Coccidioides posadasii str. Silveira]|uniref:Predicted protein n=1 Tax=Coccidioides posadasii (strain RMSCC 757 / Silveira) TaxID=443226 RepID=E9DIN1_COCPS|nr:predicted protein [Coccidioides posadasii str. Silveira]